MARLWRPIAYFFRREQFERDLRTELDFHHSMKQREAEMAGLAPQEVDFAVKRAMGNLSQAREGSRESWSFIWLEQWCRDIQQTVRILLKSPVFTACAVIILALGIGANTAIFTLLDGLLLRGLPVPESSRVVEIVLQNQQNQNIPAMSFPMFEDLRSRTRSLSGLFTWNATDVSVGYGADAHPLVAAAISGDAFITLAIKAQAGRLLLPSDDVTGKPPATVISDGFWSREYSRDPKAIGRRLLLNSRSFTVIGVLPRDFLGVTTGINPDVTITFHALADMWPQRKMLQEKQFWFMFVFGRLKPGVSQEQANAELAVISPSVFKSQISAETEFWTNGQKSVPSKLGVIAATGSSVAARKWRRSLWVVMSISALILVMACANLAGLSLARMATRQRELALRLALGAKRSRLVRQLLSESLIISLSGAALGIVMAIEATRALMLFLSDETNPLVLNVHPDWRVLSFAVAIATLTGLLVGAAPAFGGTDVDANDALKQARIGLGWKSYKFGFGRSLVVVQVSLAVVLITGSILFVKTLKNLKDQDLGFSRNNIVFVSLDASKTGLKATQMASLYTDILQRLRRLPQVSAAGLTDITPIEGAFSWTTLRAELWPSLSAQQRMLYTHAVTPQYFQTLGMRLQQGRDFIANDSQAAIAAGILSASAAKTLFPGKNAVGQMLQVDRGVSRRIIGIVDDAKYASLRDNAPITIYTKLTPYPSCNLAIRSTLDRETLVRDLRDLLRATGKDIRISNPVAMTDQINRALKTERLIALLASFYAGLAAVLVAVGLFGTVGYSAARRTGEIGLRLALGSSREGVLWLVMRHAFTLSAWGLVVGIPAAIATANAARLSLFGAVPYDVLSLAATAGLILVVTTAASFIPAFRASRLNPTQALRSD